MRASSRGLTLPEVLVGLFLAGIFPLLLYQLLQTGYRVGHEEISRSSKEQSLQMMASTLVSDLKNSTPGGVSLAASGETLATHPVDTVTEGGRLVYEDRLWLWRYLSEAKRLERVEILSVEGRPFDANALRLSPGELADLVEERRVSRSLDGVTEFRVENPTGTEVPLVGSPLSIRVEVEIPEAGTRKELSFQTLVHIRSAGL